MKILYVVRHAKSSWEEPGLSDFDRPLNERGKEDAPRMGKRLRDKNVTPDLMLSSPAKRALSTCKRMADVFEYPKESIQTDQRLYLADDDEILSVIRRLDDRYQSVFMFGHNAGLTDFVNQLNGKRSEHIQNVPTCGVAAFQLNTNSWNRVEFGMGEMLFYDYPKNKQD